MADSAKRLLDIIKATSENTKDIPSQVVGLKIKTLNPLVFTYNDKLIIDKNFYVLDKNFSTTNLWNGSTYYDLHVGDTVKAMMMNNAQTYYVLANKSSGGGGGGTNNYNNLDNKPQINSHTLSGNMSTSDLGINVPTSTSQLTNDSNFVVDSSYVHTDNNFTSNLKNHLNESYQHASDADILVGDTPRTYGFYKIQTTNYGHIRTLGAVQKSDITALGIPAQDTTYSNFTGTDGTTAGASGLVPAPATTDSGKYLKADGTWGTPSGGGGTSDYSNLSNKPQINSVTLSGNKTSHDLGIQAELATPLTADLYLVDGTPTSLAEGYYYTGAYKIYVNGTQVSSIGNSILSLSKYDEGQSTEEGFFATVFAGEAPSGNTPLLTSIYYSDDGEGNYVWAYHSFANLTQADIRTSMPRNPTIAVYDRTVPSVKLMAAQLDTKENISNKVTSLSSSSTNNQYPSAKCVYDYIDSMITQAIGGSY